ncbi:MAG: ABC transporter permease, partial [Pseudomonadota bacterium]
MIFTIALRELRTLFLSPLAWTILAVVQAILAFLFLARVELYQLYQTQLAGMESAPGVTEIIVPDLLG